MDCILWTKAKDKAGYGVSWFNGKYIRAHQKAYIQNKGEVPQGLIIRHTCDNRSCINPEHLILGTYQDNSTDMTTRNRQAQGSKVGTAKLTEELVLIIKSLSASSSKLASMFNCSKTTIKDIKNNKIWKHV